ncbi:MAG TPA: Gfo/Idh/MocA family oxidoreductase [Firmicutes bacterium]|nr:Gfo/Idh/MocA family oxidoreductase [Bacillota bacterium]
MTQKKTRLALIGYGAIGKVHTYAYKVLPFHYAELPLEPVPTWVAVRRRHTGPQALREGGFKYCATDFHTAINAADTDFVDCCTPNHLHLPVAVAASKAGKAIYCEKPLARDLAEAKTMLAAVEEAGVAHQVAFNYRFVPAVIRAQQLIAAGRLGNILAFRFYYLHSGYTNPNRPISWRMQKAISGSGALGDLGSHIIDLSRFLLGEYQAVSAILHTYIKERPIAEHPGATGVVDVDDAFLCQAKLANGAIGTLEATRMATGANDDLRFEIHGALGALRFNLMEPNRLAFYDATRPGEPLGGERGYTYVDTIGNYLPPAHFPSARAPVGWLRFHIASQYDFLCRLAGLPAIGATFVDGLRTQEIMTAIALSSERGAWVDMAEVQAL